MNLATIKKTDVARPSSVSGDRSPQIFSARFESEFLQANRPLLITHQWQQCHAVNRWTVDYLIERCGDQIVDVEHYPSGQREKAFVYQSMPLAEYLQMVRYDVEARQHYYLAEVPLQQALPNISAEIVRPEMLHSVEHLREVVFVGFDTLTTGHYHRGQTQALLAQITGEKTVVLFPPEDMKYLSMQPWYAMRSNHSQIPFGSASLESLTQHWPKLAKTSPLTYTVKPGELLFIPDHWLHYVYSEGESVSLTWFWDRLPRTGYGPGFRRDRRSAICKKLMMTGVQVSSRLGINKPMVSLAALLRIISRDDQLAVLKYLENFGTDRPLMRQENKSD